MSISEKINSSNFFIFLKKDLSFSMGKISKLIQFFLIIYNPLYNLM